MWGTLGTSQKHILYFYIIYTHVQTMCSSSAVSSLHCEWMPSGIKQLVDWTECQPSMIKNTIYNWRAITLTHCWINALNMVCISFIGSLCWTDDAESVNDWLFREVRYLHPQQECWGLFCHGMALKVGWKNEEWGGDLMTSTSLS